MSREHLEKAKMLLDKTGSTCVLCGDDVIITDKRRGIKPLLDLLDGAGNVSRFSAADKVVGKAAAFLYCLLEIKDLFAKVISQPALDVLRSVGISVEYEELVPAIKNRAGDGYCPMETAVWNISDPDNALIAIRDTLFHLSK